MAWYGNLISPAAISGSGSAFTLVSGQWSVEYLSQYAPLVVCNLRGACRCSKERQSNLFNLLHQVSRNRAGGMQLMQDLHAGDWDLRQRGVHILKVSKVQQ